MVDNIRTCVIYGGKSSPDCGGPERMKIVSSTGIEIEIDDDEFDLNGYFKLKKYLYHKGVEVIDV